MPSCIVPAKRGFSCLNIKNITTKTRYVTTFVSASNYCQRMRAAIPPLPNTPSWRGA